jgi:aspartyl-tRNA(Asn)/glutamyl-tRNA(Gln) amidotransferase subunit A
MPSPATRAAARLPPDPLADCDIEELGHRLRGGVVSSESLVAAYLARIEAVNHRLHAYTFIDAERALKAARHIDGLLRSGIDLGPLMGMPVSIKDFLSVDGMPTRVGSRLECLDLFEPEGSFVKALKRAGCIVLGKTRTTEFAFGGINLTHAERATNPWDAAQARTPGGSSSGAGAAMGAGLCALAIGTDAGGSVRIPAAVCGTFGYKASAGRWSTDGIFPLSTTFDSLGFLTATARDSLIAYGMLTSEPETPPRPVSRLRFGLPTRLVLDGLDAEVRDGFDDAVGRLKAAGAEIVPVDLPDHSRLDGKATAMIASELLATVGRERFFAARDLVDPPVWQRVSQARDFRADEYILCLREHEALTREARERLRGLDACINPTVPRRPIPFSECATMETAAAWVGLTSRNARIANMLGQCGVTLPIQPPGASLPFGLQLAAPHGHDSALLQIAVAVEAVLGPRPRPDIAAFAT